MPNDTWQERLDRLIKHFGTGEMLKTVAPSQATNPEAISKFAKFERLASSPGALRTILQLQPQDRRHFDLAHAASSDTTGAS